MLCAKSVVILYSYFYRLFIDISSNTEQTQFDNIEYRNKNVLNFIFTNCNDFIRD